MEDKCFFCGNEGSLVLQCKRCQANNIKKTTNLFAQLTHQADLLRQALDVVTKTANAKQLSQCHDEGNVFVLYAGTKTKAHSLIPAIEAALKETK